MATINVYERNDPTIVLNLWQDAGKQTPLDVRTATDIEFIVKPEGDDGAGDDTGALFTLTTATGVTVDAADPGNVITVTPTAADLATPGTYQWRVDRLDGTDRLTIVAPAPFIIHDV